MGLFEYTPARQILAIHEDENGWPVFLEIDLIAAEPESEVRKTVHRSASGRSMETLNESVDRIWQLQFAPVKGEAAALLNEFLASTAEGEIFRAWFYGTEAAPRSLRRTDSGYSREPFVMQGGEDDDPISVRITVIEAA